MTTPLTADHHSDWLSLSDSSHVPFIRPLGQQGQLNNILSSITTYADMSPDLTMRGQVNSWLLRRDRQALNVSDWCQLFGSNQSKHLLKTPEHQQRDHTTVHSILCFIYTSFSQYSGLDFSRVRPSDSLNTHLRFPLVCWFDWSITFCEDFFQTFGLDLSDRFDEVNFSTLGELVDFLTEQVLGVERAT